MYQMGLSWPGHVIGVRGLLFGRAPTFACSCHAGLPLKLQFLKTKKPATRHKTGEDYQDSKKLAVVVEVAGVAYRPLANRRRASLLGCTAWRCTRNTSTRLPSADSSPPNCRGPQT